MAQEQGWGKAAMRGLDGSAVAGENAAKMVRACTEESVMLGAQWAAGATVVALGVVEGGVAYLNRQGARSNRLGFTGSVTGRAIAVTGVGLGTFFVVSENNMQRCKRRTTVFKDYMSLDK